MRFRGFWAPGGLLHGRPGAVLLLGLACVVPACERSDPGAERAVLELAEDTIQLDPGVALFDVVLLAGTAIQPDTIRIRSGDVVRFVAGDAMTHAVAFDRARLAPAAAQFLAGTGQLRGPPLIAADAAWVVSFAGAPAGGYPFTDLSQGVAGFILVSPAPQSGR